MLNIMSIHLRCDNTNEIGLKCIENNKISYCINGAWHQTTHFIKCNVQNRIKWPLFKKRCKMGLFKKALVLILNKKKSGFIKIHKMDLYH